MLTPLEIENKTFNKQVVNGYSTNEVHEFMTALLKDYEQLYKENIEYKIFMYKIFMIRKETLKLKKKRERERKNF